VKPPAPPNAAFTEAAPFEPPKQLTLVCAEAVIEIADGAVIVNACVVVQLLASVTVTVYVPAASPVAVAAVPPVGVQTYVYVPVPPVPLTVAVPFDPLSQETFVCAAAVATKAVGCVTVKLCEAVHPLASVVVTV
jgi:hypothetical protein